MVDLNAFRVSLFFVFSLGNFCYVLNVDIKNLKEYETITPRDVKEVTKESCLLVFGPLLDDITNYDIFRRLQVAFKDEPKVRIAVLKTSNENYEGLQEVEGWKKQYLPYIKKSMLFFPRRKLDRSCLTPQPKFTSVPMAEEVKGNMTLQLLLLYLNSKCQTFRNLDGSLSQLGRKRLDVLQNIYHLPTNTLFPDIGTVCKRISMPSREEFINEYLFKSKPVIIEGGLKSWPAVTKWTNQFLREKFGKNEVHIKLTSDGIFEGCEKAENFSNFKSFIMPDFVNKQLPYPDLVVVRPATMDVRFSSFMDMMETERNISAYLEYSSIQDYMPELEKDIREFAMVKDVLTKRHLNLWLSNGNTLGKLHFDPFENFLCQISGTKQVILFEPHDNTVLYEGHIQEAVLGFDTKSKRFSRKKLLESTSMVMSPIDIVQPDYERFPKFKNAPAMNCTIREGDVLYMPAFWWHEVKSAPSKEHRNIAVNFWYEPFLTKEFPCPQCSMDINPHYLYKLL